MCSIDFFNSYFYVTKHILLLIMANFTTENDLLEAMRKSLNESGNFGRLKADLRSSVMDILSKNSQPNIPQEVPEETKILNDLIKEYLKWNGYVYSDKIFGTESGSSGEKVRRESLASKLGVMDDKKTLKIPLLYYILSSFRNQEM